MRRILAVFIFTAVTMLLTFNGAQWYANNAALPRYCENPAQAAAQVREILTDPAPGTGKPKRSYVVAAKLIFLVPREDSEPLQSYLDRVQARIAEKCGAYY